LFFNDFYPNKYKNENYFRKEKIKFSESQLNFGHFSNNIISCKRITSFWSYKCLGSANQQIGRTVMGKQNSSATPKYCRRDGEAKCLRYTKIWSSIYKDKKHTVK